MGDPAENRGTLNRAFEEGGEEPVPPGPMVDFPIESSSRRSTGETGAPQESAAAPTWVSSLVDVWQDYRDNGNGFFNADGFRSFLESHGIRAEVLPGSKVGGGDLVLGVTEDGAQRVYLVPNFIEPLSAMGKWFDDQGSGNRTLRVTRIGRLAVLERTGDGYSLVQRGAVS